MSKKKEGSKGPKRKKKLAARPAPIGSVVFEVSAVIPTQQYGNIQPRITVTARTIEEGRMLAMPVIEELYRQYAETPLSGKAPRFYGKVTETVKEVVPAPEKPAEAPVALTAAPAATVAVEPVAAVPKPEPVLKAEKAISLAATEGAAVLIQDQIENSVKIPEEFKKDLLLLCLKKRKELEGK